MTGTDWQPRLRESPELFPLAIDPATDRVDLVALARVDYEKASFLDARLARAAALRPSHAELAAAAHGLPVACDYIFHVGHVGSTLLSRLLGTHPAVFSVREPQALRTFAQAELVGVPWREAAFDTRLDTFLALFSRTWTPRQRALVKATSLVGELAGRLLSRDAAARGLLMTVRPETYLATILGGPNSRVELRTAAPARLARLHRRLGEQAWDSTRFSEGELAAMSWACEMTALAEAAGQHPDRTAWIDFDAFLAEPRAGLAAALCGLHGAAETEAVEHMARSAYFERYSKAPEYGYGADVRRQVLDAARAEHGVEIRRGLAWLDAAAAARPLIARTLRSAQAA
jgi:hypothetical protein